MALSDRDIIITPNRGAATEPTILFRGGDAASSASITLRVLNSGTVGTLSFEGSSGQLFSLTDTMSGTIFSVNDVSGIPSIEVLDTGLVKIAQYNGYLTVGGAGNSANATSTSTGELQVIGGAAVWRDLFVGGAGTITGNLTVNGTLNASSVSGTITNSTNVSITNDTTSASDHFVTFVSGTSGNLPVKVDGTTGLVFRPSINGLGIGISPSHALTVKSATAAATVSNAGTYAFSVGNANAGDFTIGSDASFTYLQSWNSKPLQINNQGNNVIFCNASGSVSIGATTSPRSKLEVISGSTNGNADVPGTVATFTGPTPSGQSSQVSIESNDAIAANTGGVLAFGGRYSGTALATWAAIKGLKEDGVSGNYGGYLAFFTRTHGSGYPERMRIAPSGTVNINYAGDLGYNLGVVGRQGINYQSTINTTTPGFARYGLHFEGQTTADYATGITWNGGTGSTNAQAGIYVQGSGSYGTKMYFGTTNSYATGSITRLSIDHNGYIFKWVNGTGTTHAIPYVAIQDTAPTAVQPGDLWWESDTGKLKIFYNDGSSSQWVDAVPLPDFSTYYSKAGGAINGDVSINGSLTVSGFITAGNEITAYYTSDERLKTNVRTLESPLLKLSKIRGVRFDWTDEYIQSRGGEDGYAVRKEDVGVIAQEIEKVLPEIVATRDNGYKAVKYEKIVPLLIECIKSQQMQIDQILERLEKLANK